MSALGLFLSLLLVFAQQSDEQADNSDWHAVVCASDQDVEEVFVKQSAKAVENGEAENVDQARAAYEDTRSKLRPFILAPSEAFEAAKLKMAQGLEDYWNSEAGQGELETQYQRYLDSFADREEGARQKLAEAVTDEATAAAQTRLDKLIKGKLSKEEKSNRVKERRLNKDARQLKGAGYCGTSWAILPWLDEKGCSTNDGDQIDLSLIKTYCGF